MSSTSHLSNKSIDNLNASNLLISNKLYASSVHCSYYAMLQHMTCKLKDCWNITFTELSNKSKADKKNSHEFLIKSSLDIVEMNKNSFTKRAIKKQIYDLKTFREESDYHEIEILEVKSIQALDLSKIIIQKLNEFI